MIKLCSWKLTTYCSKQLTCIILLNLHYKVRTIIPISIAKKKLMLREVKLLVQGNSDSSASVPHTPEGDETWLGVGSGNRVACMCVCVSVCGESYRVVSALFRLTPKRWGCSQYNPTPLPLLHSKVDLPQSAVPHGKRC